MNERIEKALGESLALFFSKNATLNPATFAINCPPEVFENFAEALIRECADIATINQYEAFSAGYYVKKHFGLENT